jgi:hypothetical protein
VKASEVHLPRVREYVTQRKAQGREVREIQCDTRGERLLAGLPVRVSPNVAKGIVLQEDTFVELGNPSTGSCSFVVWNDGLSTVVDGRITCIGPDIQQSEGQSLPFGQVMIVSGADVRKWSGELRKLVLQQDASYDCTEYDCESCDDRPVCDSVRDLVKLRRSKTAEAGANTG